MGKKQRQVVSDFDDDDTDLLGDNDDLDEHSDNDIVKAAFSDDESDDWEAPDEDDEEDEDSEDDEEESDDDSDDDADSEDEDEEGDDDESSSKPKDEEDDDDADEDDDDSSHSEAVQKRIERERQLRLKSERRLKKLENKERLRDAKDEFQTTTSEKETELRKLRKKKREAIEEGDTDRQEELDDQILDAKADLRQARSDYERLEKELESEPDDDDEVGSLPEAAQKWLDKYPQFHTNKQFGDSVRLADQMVARRGFDKNTDRYYEEIEKILAPQFPKIVKPAKKSSKSDKRKDAAKRERKRRSAVGGTTKPGTRRNKNSRNRRGQIRLTKADKAQMEEFGLDPTNKEEVREWARNKTD